MSKKKNFLQKLGPGLLFAGAAVGVSHLVLSTRAGADYGFGLIWLVVLANLMKYPFFEFGPRYAMATGESLLEGYHRIGKWVLWLFVIMSLGTIFTVQTAVTIVTASLASQLFALELPLAYWALIILSVSAVILIVGKYKVLDKLMKWIIIVLSVSTLIAVIIAASNYIPNERPLNLVQILPTDRSLLLFFAVFIGWMPAPLDLSVWHSLWSLEKRKENEEDFNHSQSIFDFNVGYIGTTIIALFFVALGALVMYGSGESFSEKGAVFAGQLVKLYESTMGKTSGLLVSFAAFATMFSTCITCLDAQPRTMARAQYLLFHSKIVENKIENPQQSEFSVKGTPKILYMSWLFFLIIGTLIILIFFSATMGTLVKIATIISFTTAPFIAMTNLILINSKRIPKDYKPSIGLLLLSWSGLFFLIGSTLVYIWSII